MKKIRWRPHPPHYLGAELGKLAYFSHMRVNKKKKNKTDERQKFKQQNRGFFFFCFTHIVYDDNLALLLSSTCGHKVVGK